MYQGLNGWFLKVTKIGSCLSWFLSEHNHLGIDCSESVDNDLSLHWLNWIWIIECITYILVYILPMTTATALSERASKDCWVLISTPDNQQPNPGWEWYHPTTISGRPVCFNMSNIFAWKTGSTASTDTPVPDWGIAKTSATLKWKKIAYDW